jgi:dTDP-4-dehydrorhamnose 3,5-epimerase
MRAKDVTAEWLQQQKFRIDGINQSTIEEVIFKPLKVNLDGRGDVIELWSAPWEGFDFPAHVYQSATDVGVVKCWHLHEVHTDQFAVTRGKIQVSIVDIREDSATFGVANRFVFGHSSPALLRIPAGLLHGWKCLTPPEVIVINLQTHVYDPSDEFKFPWNTVLEEIWEPKNG